MAKKSKRRTWTPADVRTLKAAAKKKTRASSIARSLKRTEGSYSAKGIQPWECPSISSLMLGLFGSRELSPAEAGCWRGGWMNHAGGDHGAAVPGRVAHFFDIVANELVGGLGMSGVDLTKAVHKHPRINPA